MRPSKWSLYHFKTQFPKILMSGKLVGISVTDEIMLFVHTGMNACI